MTYHWSERLIDKQQLLQKKELDKKAKKILLVVLSLCMDLDAGQVEIKNWNVQF